MSKQEMLIEFCVQDIIEYLKTEKQLPFDKAMQILYHSVTFEKLNDIETGLYRESSAYIYDLLNDELKAGSFVQNEI